MKKILLISAGVFLSVPAAAKICMLSNPTVVATKAQLTALESQVVTKASATELAVQVALLSARITALETQPVEPFPWLLSWITNTLSNATLGGDGNETWFVTSDQSGTTQTVGGVSLCSSTFGTHLNRGNPSASVGENCWCKMTSPRDGAWIFNRSTGSSINCMQDQSCFKYCSNDVKDSASFRSLVLALP